jgi:hypothetical protein
MKNTRPVSWIKAALRDFKKFPALIIVSAKECRGAAKAYSLGFLTPGQQ